MRIEVAAAHEGLSTNAWLVQILARSLGGDRDDERGREAVAATRIDLRELGPDRHEVRVHAEHTWGCGFWRDPGLRLRVRCPHGTAVTVRTSSADVEARGRLGDVQVQGASSDADFERIEGSFRAKTASGDVEVGVVTGSADVSTASGDVHSGQAMSPVSANLVAGDLHIVEASAGAGTRSVSGDQQLAGIVEGTVEASSVSGDIEIGRDLLGPSGAGAQGCESRAHRFSSMRRTGHRVDQPPKLSEPAAKTFAPTGVS